MRVIKTSAGWLVAREGAALKVVAVGWGMEVGVDNDAVDKADATVMDDKTDNSADFIDIATVVDVGLLLL